MRRLLLLLSVILLFAFPSYADSITENDSLKISKQGSATVYEWEASPEQLKMMNVLNKKGYSNQQIMKIVAPKAFKEIKSKTHFFDDTTLQTSSNPSFISAVVGSVSKIVFKKYGTGLQNYASLTTQGYTTQLELLLSVYNNSNNVVYSRWKGITSPTSNLNFIDMTTFCEPADGTYHGFAQFRALKADGHWQVENKLSLPISYDNPYQ